MAPVVLSLLYGYFLETHGTIFHGKRVAVELIVRVLACLAEGLGIRATARVFEVDPNTVLQWLVEAAEQLHAFSCYFLCDIHVNRCNSMSCMPCCAASKMARSVRTSHQALERSPHWVWTAMDPESKLLVAIDVGARTLAMAQRVVHQVVQVLAPGCVPLFLTDGFKEYLTALLTHYGQWGQLPRRQTKVPRPSRVGCHYPRCSMRRSSKPYAAGVSSACSTAWCSAPWMASSRCLRHVAGTSIPRLWSGSTWTFANAWRQSGVGSTRCVRARTACNISWSCSRATTISAAPYELTSAPADSRAHQR